MTACRSIIRVNFMRTSAIHEMTSDCERDKSSDGQGSVLGEQRRNIVKEPCSYKRIMHATFVSLTLYSAILQRIKQASRTISSHLESLNISQENDWPLNENDLDNIAFSTGGWRKVQYTNSRPPHGFLQKEEG